MSDSRRMRRAVGQLAVRVSGHAVWVSALMCGVLLAGISIGETLIPRQHVLSTLANHLLIHTILSMRWMQGSSGTTA